MQNVSSSNSQAVIVPKLRFPEFGSSWQMKTLGDILSVKHGKDYKGQSNQIGKYPVMGTGGIITYIDSFMCDWECVCIGRKGTINKPIYMSEPFWSVDTLFFTQPQKGENPKFQYYLFETINWLLHNEASGVPSLSASVIANIKKAIPTIQEQNKIAAFFTVIDTLINKQNNLVESLKLYKRGVITAIFDRKFRFTKPDGTPFPEWSSVPFGDIIIEYNDRTKTENEDILLSAAIEGMFLNTELFGHQRGTSNIGYKKIKKGTLVLSTQNLHLGNANVNLRFEHGMVSPAYKTYHIKGCSQELMYHWIKREEAKQFFFNATTVGASACRRNVEWETLYSQVIELPSIEEEVLIVRFLNSIDNSCIQQETLLTQLLALKKTLLQQMFI